MKKKTVIIQTDCPCVKTGLGRNGKEIANYLYRTGKYNIVYYASGLPWENVEYQKYPYKIVGALPMTQQEIDNINRDPNYARACAYGAYYIDRVVKEFKPDVMIFSNDSWSFDGYWTKNWWNKFHCVPQITLDSIPFLPQQIEFIKNSKDFFVWAEFAEKESKRLGFNNVKTLTGIVNDKPFKKLPKLDKLNLKRKFNIPEDSFICGFTFRNQTRKEIFPLLEGFKTFYESLPSSANVYLLLWTNFSEGWDIPRYCKDNKIDETKILTGYICKTCGEYEIKSYTGQDLDCKFCGAKKGQITSNVSLGVTEEELNEVYNLMDCYYQGANASGLEIPIIEALYCELPIATMDYAATSTFIGQPFTYSLDFSWTYQIGTNFKRSCPYAFSVTKFLKKFYEMTEAKRSELGQKARQWALSKFSPDVVGKQWENYIDSLPEVNYDYEFTEKPKNPNAIIPPTEDNAIWIKSLYKEILNMTVDETDDGFKNWDQQLKNGAKREDIHKFFINVAVEKNKTNPSANQLDFKTLLLNNGKKNFLLVAPESAGDILYVTSVLKGLRKSYPKETWNLNFACKPEFAELLEGCTEIDKILPYMPFMEQEIACLGQGTNKGLFDGYCFITALSQRFLSYLGNHNTQL